MADMARSVLQRISQSLFFLPTVVVALCAALAWLTTVVELDGDFPLLLSVTVAGGRSLSAAVAGATITVAAIVFSITALISQITATQYSPRAVSGFFEDRFQQLVIGFVVGTFTYSLLVLAGLAGSTVPGDPEASLSATMVVVLGIASVIAIVGYLDHSLRRMQIAAVVRRIAGATADAVHRTRREPGEANALEERAPSHGKAHRIWATRTGWVQDIDGTALARHLPAGFVVNVAVRVGEPIFPGDLLATSWSPDGGDDRDPAGAVRRCVHIGRDRSLARDPSYGFRQLVDIALRALSPGINDPTTAVDVIHHLKPPLRETLRLDPPVRVVSGPNGQRVFLAEAPSRSDLVHAAFGEIRLAAAQQPSVLHALLEVETDLIAELREADLEGRTAALVAEALLAADAARSAGFPAPDRERVLRAAKGPDFEGHSEDGPSVAG